MDKVDKQISSSLVVVAYHRDVLTSLVEIHNSDSQSPEKRYGLCLDLHKLLTGYSNDNGVGGMESTLIECMESRMNSLCRTYGLDLTSN